MTTGTRPGDSSPFRNYPKSATIWIARIAKRAISGKLLPEDAETPDTKTEQPDDNET